MTAAGCVVLGVGAAAVAEDLARRRVSNWISGTALLSGFILQVVERGWIGAANALAGTAVGFGVFAIFYWLNGLGGGDVKLMAAFGSLLGPATILCAAWMAAVAGGMMAAAISLAKTRWHPPQKRPCADAASIPYAPALVAGVWLAELARG